MLSFIGRGSLSMQITCSTAKLFSSTSHLIPATLPSKRETHFWYILPEEFKDPSLFSQYLNLLPKCEKETVFSMRGDELQRRALLARVLVRTTLARYTNSLVSPSLLKFKKNTFGKPEVEWQYDKEWDPPSLHFNISHTSTLIACGVTRDMAIGIDVEEKQRKTRNSLLSFARRYFSPVELEYLQTIQDPEIQRHEFVKLWTLKEAYVKALGTGFSATPFSTFTIRFKGSSNPSLQVSGDSNSKASRILLDSHDGFTDPKTDWVLGLFEVDNSHYASICVEKKSIDGEENENDAMQLKVWKTLPFVKDEFVSGTDCVRIISGLA